MSYDIENKNKFFQVTSMVSQGRWVK